MLCLRWYNYNNNDCNNDTILIEEQKQKNRQHQSALLVSSLPTINIDDDDHDDNLELQVSPVAPLSSATISSASSITGDRIRYQKLRDRLRQEQNQHYQIINNSKK